MRNLQLKQMKDMGYDTYTRSYEDIVSDLIEEVSELRIKEVQSEAERFKQELKRLMKPTN